MADELYESFEEAERAMKELGLGEVARLIKRQSGRAFEIANAALKLCSSENLSLSATVMTARLMLRIVERQYPDDYADACKSVDDVMRTVNLLPTPN